MKILLVLAGLVLVAVVAVIMRKSAKAKLNDEDVSLAQRKSPTMLTKHKPTQNTIAAKEIEAPVITSEVKVPEMTITETPFPAESPAQIQKLEKTAETIPEDSVLRRHYLSTRQTERESISHPYPTDSMLRRHYENMPQRLLNICTGNRNVEISAQPEPVKKLTIPEDSTLRRHFLTQLQAEIESVLFPRPTDSILRRHYDNYVKARLEQYLTGHAI